jgi:hypothetical protein
MERHSSKKIMLFFASYSREVGEDLLYGDVLLLSSNSRLQLNHPVIAA